MLRVVKEVIGCAVAARDGEIGTVRDVYFEDRDWTVRYLVVEPSEIERAMPPVLSPIGVRHIDAEAHRIELDLDVRQVAEAPGMDVRQPVSRRMERDYYDHHGWGYYWYGEGPWGSWPTPSALYSPSAPWGRPPTLGDEVLDPSGAGPDVGHPSGAGPEDVSGGGRPGGEEPASPSSGRPGEEDVRLRSAGEVEGYHLLARDGEIGHVVDLLVDGESWRLRCVIVDTSNWWFGKKVSIPVERFGAVDWAGRHVSVDMSREQVKAAGEYDEKTPGCSPGV
jgi:sporulation protein YlmC with PRC-barrel domain